MKVQANAILSLSALALAFSASTAHANGGNRSKELYAIFDLATPARKQVVIKAMLDGMSNNFGKSDTMTPVVLDEPPEKPGRFKLVDSLEGNPMASFLAMAPASTRAQFKRATCDGAVWTSDSVRQVEGIHRLKLTMCLFAYRGSGAPGSGGYHLDVYGLETEERGGGLISMASRAIATAAVGSADAWVSKSILDIVRSVRRNAGAKVSYVDGSLEFQGEPWNEDGQVTAAQEHLAGH